MSDLNSDETVRDPANNILSIRQKIVIAAALMLSAHSTSFASSIRYGFLVEFFTNRGTAGSAYGFIESSKIIGYIVAFATMIRLEKYYKKCPTKWMLCSTMLILAVSSLLSGAAVLFSPNNTVLVIFSIAMKIVQGYVGYFYNISIIDILHFRFLKRFDLMNGLVQLGYYSGHGLGEWSGAALYDRYGYFIPFATSTIFLLMMLVILGIVLPASPSYSLKNETEKQSEGSETEGAVEEDRLTWIVFTPLFATTLINCIYNLLQVTVAPYLKQHFSIPLAIGSIVLSVSACGMGIGSVISGIIVQREIISTFIQMLVGALIVGVSILIVFPPPSITFLYNNALMCSFPSALLAGLGDPIVTVAALKAMKILQLLVMKRLTPSQTMRIAGFWLVGTACAMYSGSLVAGILLDHLEYHTIAFIMGSLCAISAVTSISLEVYVASRSDQ